MNNRHIFAISFVFGFCIAIYGITLNASEHPTITFDVNNQEMSVDYRQVDQFMSAQDVKAVKFADQKHKTLVLSDQPIVVAKQEPVKQIQVAPIVETKPYTPASLADLGLRMNRHIMLVKIPAVNVAINNVEKLPVIPPMISLPDTAQASSFTRTITAAQPVIFSMVLWLMTALSTLTVLSLLLSSRHRKVRPAIVYSGYVGAPTDMIGKGKLFDFSRDAAHGKMLQVKTTYLNMLWHIGRLSQNDAIDTYFYTAYYIPSHHQYAAILKRRVIKKHTTA